MKAKLAALALRRERLVAHAAEQRVALGDAAGALAAPGRLAERLLLVKRVAQAHPAWTTAALAAVSVILVRRRRAALWLSRAWVAWRGWQALAGWLRRTA